MIFFQGRCPITHLPVTQRPEWADVFFGGNYRVSYWLIGDHIIHSSRHLLSLINDILDLSKVEAGKMALELSSVPLRPLLDHRQGFIQISIQDTGIGITDADLEKIFKPFEQADTSSRRRYQGTGLGLSLTRSLVELQGGTIWAESPGLGKGSTFCFIIPRN
jgi:signal transduction histidine kinase